MAKVRELPPMLRACPGRRDVDIAAVSVDLQRVGDTGAGPAGHPRHAADHGYMVSERAIVAVAGEIAGGRSPPFVEVVAGHEAGIHDHGYMVPDCGRSPPTWVRGARRRPRGP